MLSILTLAYQGKSVQDLLVTPPAERQQLLFATYVERMLERRKASVRYDHWWTRRCPIWLAGQMIQHNQMEVYLERMQPDWLPSAQSRRWYGRQVGLIVGLNWGLSIGPVFSVGYWLVDWLYGGKFSLLGNDLGSGLVLGILGGIIGGPLGFLLGNLLSAAGQIKPAEILTWRWQNVWERV